mmetsp:Transcript_124955/g.400291  ORF Transcript_124955/g.400291 Transcript_124955/m.400291 type:complete len:255 (+) Transcript_124955:303-1067(+)
MILNGPSPKCSFVLPCIVYSDRLSPIPVTLAGSNTAPLTGCPCFDATKSPSGRRHVFSLPAGTVWKSCDQAGTDMLQESAVCSVNLYNLPSPTAVTSSALAAGGRPNNRSSPRVRQFEKPPPVVLITPANSMEPASSMESPDCERPPITWSSMTNHRKPLALDAPWMSKSAGASRAPATAACLYCLMRRTKPTTFQAPTAVTATSAEHAQVISPGIATSLTKAAAADAADRAPEATEPVPSGAKVRGGASRTAA